MGQLLRGPVGGEIGIRGQVGLREKAPVRVFTEGIGDGPQGSGTGSRHNPFAEKLPERASDWPPPLGKKGGFAPIRHASGKGQGCFGGAEFPGQPQHGFRGDAGNGGNLVRRVVTGDHSWEVFFPATEIPGIARINSSSKFLSRRITYGHSKASPHVSRLDLYPFRRVFSGLGHARVHVHHLQTCSGPTIFHFPVEAVEIDRGRGPLEEVCPEREKVIGFFQVEGKGGKFPERLPETEFVDARSPPGEKIARAHAGHEIPGKVVSSVFRSPKKNPKRSPC